MASQKCLRDSESSDYSLSWETSTSTINNATVKGNILCMETALEIIGGDLIFRVAYPAQSKIIIWRYKANAATSGH